MLRGILNALVPNRQGHSNVLGYEREGGKNHQPMRLLTRRRFGCLKNLFNFLRGQKRGRDKGPEKELFGKTTQIKLSHFPNNLENSVFPKKLDFDLNLPIKSNFLPKP